MVRRTTLIAVAGNREAATASMHETRRIGTGYVEPLALIGFELGHRLMLLELFGGSDRAAEELYQQFLEMVPDTSVPFLEIHKGFGAQLFGDDSRLHGVLERYGHDPGQVLRSLYGDYLLRTLGDTIARAGAAAMAKPAYAALTPYSGLLNCGGGISVGLPVDDILSRLAALVGDATSAVRHGRAAVAMARSMESPPMVVQCLDHLADALALTDHGEAEVARAEAALLAPSVGVERIGPSESPTTRDDSGRSAELRRESAGWEVASPLGAARLPDSAGLRQLARLLSTPGVEVTAVELAGGASDSVAADLGPALDAQAKRAYRQRLLELEAAVDDAAACNDPVRGERAQVEIDALIRELERAVGLGGRDRPSGSGAERARVNVVRSLKRAIGAIAQQAPDLGAHLEVSVRTGRYCCYLPEPAAALRWIVQA
jgi:hypothetical protein